MRLLCIVLFFVRLLAWTIHPNLFFLAKDCPELESKFVERVHVAIEYASTIDNFDNLMDPKTLACHCLGPEPS